MLITLAEKKKYVIIPTLIVSIISVIYILLVPEYWISVATIKPNFAESEGLNLSGSLLGLGSSLIGGGITSSSAELITVMNSRRFSEMVIDEFNLHEYFELKGVDKLKDDEKALRGLREQIMRYNVNPETGVITIGAETKDRMLSRDIVNYYTNKIDDYNKNQRNTKGKAKRQFLEGRINEIESEMEQLNEKLKKFSAETSVVSIKEQTTGVMQAYVDLISTQTELEIEYNSLKSIYDEDDIRLIILKSKIDEVIQKKKALESNSSERYLLSIDSIPSYAIEYDTIIARMELLKKLYQYVYPQYEAARLEELKDLPTIDIIDDANSPGFRYKPRRAQFCILMFFASVLISSFTVLVNYYVSDEKKKKFSELKHAIISKRKK